METLYVNILIFIITLLVYYFAIKTELTVDDVSDVKKYQQYYFKMCIGLASFFSISVLGQWGINSWSMIQKCGGSAAQNVGACAIMTLLPWLFIFGAIIIVLIMFPGFKSAFSDVIGYFLVYNSAGDILGELLVVSDVDNQLKKTFKEPVTEQSAPSAPSAPTEPSAPSAPTEPTKEPQSGGSPSKKDYEDLATVIVKILGNKSILINQIVPENFSNYWNILTPLMYPKYQEGIGNDADILEEKKKLLAIVNTRDNVGEAFWYLYTAVLLICLVDFNITRRGCVRSMQSMEDNYQQFLDDQSAAAEAKASAATTYSVTS